jgi:hypothetical protein
MVMRSEYFLFYFSRELCLIIMSLNWTLPYLSNVFFLEPTMRASSRYRLESLVKEYVTVN